DRWLESRHRAGRIAAPPVLTPKALHNKAQGRAAHPGSAHVPEISPEPQRGSTRPPQPLEPRWGTLGVAIGTGVRLRRPRAVLCNAFGVAIYAPNGALGTDSYPCACRWMARALARRMRCSMYS